MLLRKEFASDEEAVECLSRYRARALPALVAMYVLLQGPAARTIANTGRFDLDQAIAWLLMSGVLLTIIASSGIEGIMHRGWRPYLNDELTRSHRLRAQAFGFWAILAAAICTWAASLWVALSPLQVVHLIVTLGIAGATLRYALLERRALK